MRFSGDQLILTREIAAVKLARADGAAGPLLHIPPDSHVRRRGPSRLSGMVEIDWENQCYAVFEQDLDQRAVSSLDSEAGLASRAMG